MATSTVETEVTGPVFFWKPHETPYGFLSQWYLDDFEADGIVYASTEMWMMIQKAKLFGDEDIAQQMMRTTNPATHQKLGRKAKGFDKAKWDENKSRIVEEGNYHKFTKSKDSARLADMLLETGSRELVEASPVDRIWGVGYGAAKAEANRDKWGENRLGRAITAVRDRLRAEREQ